MSSLLVLGGLMKYDEVLNNSAKTKYNENLEVLFGTIFSRRYTKGFSPSSFF